MQSELQDKCTTVKLPVFFHNLLGYDGHILINALNQTHRKIRINPNNMEKYMAFSVDHHTSYITVTLKQNVIKSKAHTIG